MRTTLNGFTKSRDVFVARIVARENLPKWECMWDDCIQEEYGGNHYMEVSKEEMKRRTLLL